MNPFVRPDHQAFKTRIPPASRILDVGCGDGALMRYLQREIDVDVRGLELTSEGVATSLSHGLSVIQGDAETDLSFFPDNGFDFAILSRTLEALKNPKRVLSQLARIAPEILLSFHNQGHWKTRLDAAARGHIPKHIGDDWFDADRLHPISLRDVLNLAQVVELEPVAFAPILDSRLGRFREKQGLLNITAREIILHLRRI